jgi:hypothetical protein
MNSIISFLTVHCTFFGYVFAIAENNNHVFASQLTANSIQIKSHGSIKGMILDKTTRKPLVGVNVTVRGTRLGGATNRK